MISNLDELIEKFNEHQLIVEEVLGGMDMMISKLEERLTILEKQRSLCHDQELKELQDDIQNLKASLNKRLFCH